MSINYRKLHYGRDYSFEYGTKNMELRIKSPSEGILYKNIAIRGLLWYQKYIC